MNLAPFTGPGSTPSRRRFWDQARAIVLASQKLAGRNVTISEHIGKGTIINARRDRAAAAEPCGPCPPPWSCPDECTIPEADCVRYVSFQVKLTQCDIDAGGVLLHMHLPPEILGEGLQITFNGIQWLFTWSEMLAISVDDVPQTECQCYNIVAGFTQAPVTQFFCVNGVSASQEVSGDPDSVCHLFSDGIFFGDDGNELAATNRKYRHMFLSTGFDSDTDSFDDLVNATVITEGGVNVLLLNDITAYGETNVSWRAVCDGCLGACCHELSCSEQLPEDCNAEFDLYFGPGSACDDVGACCVDGVCSLESIGDCCALGGGFMGIGSVCTPETCTE